MFPDPTGRHCHAPRKISAGNFKHDEERGGAVSDMDDFNGKVIEEFRANSGKVGGPFEGAPVLLLHHNGAKTGTERVNPLMYQQVGGDYAIFASFGGQPRDPQWFRNLVAHPEVTIEVGASTVKARARVAEGNERDSIWEIQKERYPQFAEYEKTATPRVIPVVVLAPEA
jgi:deazaflavin-dependent oxidoreductase (nitroreductase family)